MASTTVTFADLTHTGVAVDANNNPLAVGYLAAYVQAHLGDAVSPVLFKYPAALSEYLSQQRPQIACFTHYMWNARLGLTYARAIKGRTPETVVVMGGPNYPVDAVEQAAYLRQHPEIDFFVDGEGEIALLGLLTALADTGLDAGRLRASGRVLPGVHYVVGDEFVRGPEAPRILDLDRDLPSPYTTGLLDPFFDERLTPMVQTSRGCPYSCTFCHDGIPYMNKTRAFSAARVAEELDYVERRARTPTLQLADLNWGMFPNDIVTARRLAESRRRSGWPRNVMVATAKNQKDRIVEMSRLLGDALQVGASVQSTDPEVLAAVKRTNISLDAIVTMTKGATASGTGSFSEIILGLPGDTREKHVKSVFDMLDAGIEDVRLFQFILLPGTEANDRASRAWHRYRTGFRVLARSFGMYDILGTAWPVAEIQEVCLGTRTLPAADYLECRAFDLTIAIFNNGGPVREFLRLAEALGVRRSTVLQRIHTLAQVPGGALDDIYEELHREEARNFFPSQEALERFLAEPGTLPAYLRGEYGVNHVYKARTTALLSRFDAMVALTHRAVREVLAEAGRLDDDIDQYLDELARVVVARKTDLLSVDEVIDLDVHFDFPALHAAGYRADPRTLRRPEGLTVRVSHSGHQRADLQRYFTQYGRTPQGIGQFLQRNDSHLSVILYRGLEVAPVPAA